MVVAEGIECPDCMITFFPRRIPAEGSLVHCPRCKSDFTYVASHARTEESPVLARKESPPPSAEPWCFAWVDGSGTFLFVLGLFLFGISVFQKSLFEVVVFVSQGLGAMILGPLFKLGVTAARDLRRLADSASK